MAAVIHGSVSKENSRSSTTRPIAPGMNITKLANNIRSERIERGLKPDALAILVGMKPDVYRRLERAAGRPRHATIILIAETLASIRIAAAN